MSAGKSSQVAACFSVDRTKYLMLSKSIPDRSLPQVGIGFFSNNRSAFKRVSSIHCGSLFFALMSRTTASDRPRFAEAPATSESDQPNLYEPSASMDSRCGVVVISSPSGGLVGADLAGGPQECGWCRPRRRGQWWP